MNRNSDNCFLGKAAGSSGLLEQLESSAQITIRYKKSYNTSKLIVSSIIKNY